MLFVWHYVALFTSLAAAEYLQAVTHSAGVTTLNVTCTFASNDLTLQCSVELVGPTPLSLTGTTSGDPPTAHIMVC